MQPESHITRLVSRVSELHKTAEALRTASAQIDALEQFRSAQLKLSTSLNPFAGAWDIALEDLRLPRFRKRAPFPEEETVRELFPDQNPDKVVDQIPTKQRELAKSVGVVGRYRNGSELTEAVRSTLATVREQEIDAERAALRAMERALRAGGQPQAEELSQALAQGSLFAVERAYASAIETGMDTLAVESERQSRARSAETDRSLDSGGSSFPLDMR